jgi:hypothetical protein
MLPDRVRTRWFKILRRSVIAIVLASQLIWATDVWARAGGGGGFGGGGGGFSGGAVGAVGDLAAAVEGAQSIP